MNLIDEMPLLLFVFWSVWFDSFASIAFAVCFAVPPFLLNSFALDLLRAKMPMPSLPYDSDFSLERRQ